ncbi:MAG: hypothetical protein GY953_33230 [bacterium]|nr:hypothetical protein [bacterium]
MLEASSWEEVAIRRPCSGAIGQPRTGFQETVIELIEGPDAWLAACSVTLAGELEVAEALEPVRAMSDHPDLLVRQAAGAVLGRLSSPKNK